MSEKKVEQNGPSSKLSTAAEIINKISLEHLPEAVIILDLEGKIVFLNQKAVLLIGFSIEEAINQPFCDLVQLQYHDALVSCANIIDRISKLTKNQNFSQIFNMRPKNSLEITIEINASPIYEKSISLNSVIFSLRDVTTKMKIQDEQLKRGHLKSLGIFAGRIAHEFNNILTGLLGNLSLAKEMAEDNNDLKELIINAQEAGERAKNVTAELFSVSRDGIIIKMLTPLVQTLQRSVDETLSKTNYQIELHLPKDLWLIEVDEEQIVQLFNQILINAKESMTSLGKINIVAENISLESPSDLPLKPKDYLKIQIRDEGAGIPKMILSKIFDPFFTTKSNHSGLGLSSAFSIAIDHDGLITATSEEGKGTTITIYLPAVRRRENEIKEITPEPKTMPKISRILVMDDEELICKVALKVLKFLGYKGAMAHTSEDAIMMFRQAKEAGEPFDVVILDLTVPNGMGGVECLKELQKIDPEVTAIVSTGFTHHPIMSNYNESGFKAVLAKPYTSTELESVLSKILK